MRDWGKAFPIQGTRRGSIVLGLGLVVGAPVAGQGGIVLQEQRIASDEGGLLADLDDRDRFGAGVAWLGDLDGDGRDELAVGTPGDDDGATDPGAVHVLFLDAAGMVAAEQKISAFAGGFGAGLDGGDRFGSALAAAGDLDGDGVPDLLVGAPGDDDGGQDRGAVWVLYLDGAGAVKAKHKLSSTSGGLGGGVEDGDGFGAALAFLGDQDGDGAGDLAVGAPGDDAGGLDRGAVWVLLLDAAQGVLAKTRLGTGSGGFGGALDDGDAFGSALAAPGRIDGDLFADLAVGAPGDDDGGAERGAVWVVFLDAGGAALGEAKVGLGAALADGDAFGSALAGLGDLDANGVPELLVGAPGTDGGGADRGGAWVVLLDGAGAVLQQLLLAPGSAGFVGPLADGDAFGSALAAGGDVDGLDAQELAVGAPGTSHGGPERGAVWVLFTREVGTQVGNLGNGTNPNALVPGSAPPGIGRIWDPIIDLLVGGRGQRGDPIFHFLGLSDGQFSGQRITPIGQLLISLDPQDFRGFFVSVPGQRFQIPVPNDVNLVGRPLFSQGAQLDPLGLFLTNGLDLVIGF